MPTAQESAPITDERRQAVAQWVETNVRPVLHVADAGVQTEGQPQEFELRDYQVEAWIKLEDARAQERTRALGNLATGLGKTFVAGVDVMRYRERCASQDPPTHPRTLYVSHQGDINEQAAGTFRALMPDAEIDFFKTKREQLPDADITFATIQSLYRELGRFDPQDFEYIIWDESHHLEAKTFRAVRDYFEPIFEHAITATLERMDGRDIQEYFGEPLYQKTLPEGIAEGWLADVDYHIVFDDIVKQLMEEGFEPKTLKEFHELFQARPRNEVIARNIREEQHRIGLDTAKTIVFCEDVAHAEEMAELLDGVAYHSNIKKKDRRRILGAFRSGDNQVICTVDMFNEGMNIPDARLVVFLRSTQSGTIFEQQLGRGLRRAPSKEKVSVLDFVANIERIAKIRELSKSIQHRASELGQRDIGEEDTSGDDSSGPGLRIRTRHSDFDFDKLAVDLLERYVGLNSTPKAPEGIMSVKVAARELGIAEPTVLKLAQQHGWDLPVYRFGSQTGRGLGSEQVEHLKNADIVATPQAEEYLSLKAAAKMIGIGPETLRSMIDEAGWELPTRKFGPALAKAITHGQLQNLRKLHPEKFVDAIPESWMSVGSAARHLRVGVNKLRGVVKELGWELPQYKVHSSVSEALSPEQVEELRQHPSIALKPPGSDVVSVYALAEELKVAPATIRAIVQEEGLTLDVYRFGRSTEAEGVTTEQASLIKTSSKLTPPPPEGWLSIRGAAKEIGVNPETVERVASEFGWKLEVFRFGTKQGRALTPAQVEALKRHKTIASLIERKRKRGKA